LGGPKKLKKEKKTQKYIYIYIKLFSVNLWPLGSAANVILSFSIIVNNEKTGLELVEKTPRISGKEVKSREVLKNTRNKNKNSRLQCMIKVIQRPPSSSVVMFIFLFLDMILRMQLVSLRNFTKTNLHQILHVDSILR